MGRLTAMGLMLVDDQKMGEKVSTPTDGEGLAPTHHLGASHKSQTVSCALDFVYTLDKYFAFWTNIIGNSRQLHFQLL